MSACNCRDGGKFRGYAQVMRRLIVELRRRAVFIVIPSLQLENSKRQETLTLYNE